MVVVISLDNWWNNFYYNFNKEIIMLLKLRRIIDNGKETLGVLNLVSVDREIFQCFTLEDQYRLKKVMADTRIPAGTYEIKLRTEGRLHTKYKKKFPEMHKGMLHITKIPNFKYVYIHIGNTKKDTAGCPLVGNLPAKHLFKSNRYKVIESTLAYKRIYPQIVESILIGHKAFITIIDNY